jgi:hypothetical protein
VSFPSARRCLFAPSLSSSSTSSSLRGCVSQALATSLPPSTESMPAVEEDHEDAVLTEVDVEAMKERARQQRADAYDSDEDGGGGGGQRVQCAQQ